MKNIKNTELESDKLLRQYDLIYSFFKTTSEAFDGLDWEGEILSVVFSDSVIEEYTLSDLKKLIPEL
jgi:hypothetical protein